MKRTTKLSLLALLVMVCLVATVALVACKGNDGGFALDKTEVTVAEGSSATVRVDKNETGESVDWTVDKSDVVQIVTKNNNLCYIKGLKAGSAVLTAKAGEATATVNVTVTASNVDTITITKDGNAVNAAEVVRGQTITLVATSSKGNAITWESDDETIATVDGGVVRGVAPGMTNITAKTSGGQKSVAVTVNAAQDDDYYELTLDKGAADAVANPGTWAYWTEWAQFTTKQYYNGTVTVDFTENGGNWYNLQLFYVDSTISQSKYYKLTLDIDSSASGHVTINGFVLELQEGKHTYDVYFVNGTGISMQFGVEGANPVIDIPVAKVSISNIHYEEDTSRVTLKTPSFTYNDETGVITITDENEAGVKGYILNLYKDNELVTGVSVVNGEEVDWSLVESGTYQAKIKAVAANVHYIDSDESAAQEIEVVNEGGISYEFYNIPNGESTPKDAGGANAKQTPGVWTYWSEGWVTIRGKYEDGKLTVTYSNNSGNWYDTQLNYRHPGLVNGKTYKLQLQITSDKGKVEGDDQSKGSVTLNGKEFVIYQGTRTYDIVFTENGDLSIQFTLGLNGQNNQQHIQSATMEFVILGCEEVEPEQLKAPSFELVADNVIMITDENTEGVAGYELGFFQGEELKATVTVKHGEVVDLTNVPAGEYTVKLRAVAASNSVYLTSEWSDVEDTMTSENENTPIVYSGETGFTEGWRYWNEGTTVDSCYIDKDGVVHLTYSGKGAWYGMQLFYKPTNESIKSVTIKSSVDGKITVCGQVMTLTAGQTSTVTVDNYKSNNGSAIDIQFGIYEGAIPLENGGTFEITYEADTFDRTQLNAPSFTMDPDTKVISITANNDAGIGSYELGFFQGESEEPVKIVTITDGATVDPNVVFAGEYTLKLRAVAEDLHYITSDWSTSTATITSTNGNQDLDYAAEGEFSDGWRVWYVNWESNIAVQHCYLDSNNTVHLKYTGTYWESWGVQLFYKTSETHNYKITIRSSVDGDIVVCGQTVTLKANDTVEVNVSGYTSAKGSAIDIQFGTGSTTLNGGEFQISYEIVG